MPIKLISLPTVANPTLETGHVYRIVNPRKVGRVYFTYVAGEDIIVYLDSARYSGGWNPASTLIGEQFVEVTLQEV